MSNMNDLLKDVPEAFKPVYEMPHANSQIMLYDGIVKLHRDETIFTGQGTVYVAWLPSPKICFEIKL